jgi:hypothetical protein
MRPPKPYPMRPMRVMRAIVSRIAVGGSDARRSDFRA